MTRADISAGWYRSRADRYTEIAAIPEWYTYLAPSHPKLTGKMAVFDRLLGLVRNRLGLNLGCGASAHDVFSLTSAGYDLRETLPFPDGSFDFAYCDSVLQHRAPPEVNGTSLPEAVRVFKPGGALQLLLKWESGVLTVRDSTYDKDRDFLLYDTEQIVERLRQLGMTLVEAEDSAIPGDVLRCTDSRQIEICLMWARKD